ETHREILESTVEIDDAELERYLAGGPLDLQRLRRCFVEAMNRGHVIPILFTAATTEVGVDDLLHVLAEEAPSPANGRPRRLRQGGELVEVACDPDAPVLGHVFKVATDPYLGKLSSIRLLQGSLDAKTPFVCGEERRTFRAGHVLYVDQILHSPDLKTHYQPVALPYPQPMISLAVAPKKKGEEVKLAIALARLCEEDPTLHHAQDQQTGETIISGIGELHLQVAI